VVSHEMSHIKNYDIRLMMIVVVLVGMIAIMADFFLRSRWLSSRDDRREGGGILAIFGLVLIILSPIIANLIKLAVSRRREYLADASGALLTRFPEGLARALEKISAYGQPMASASTATAHLFIANPFGSNSLRSLFSTHPPTPDRINKLREMIGQP